MYKQSIEWREIAEYDAIPAKEKMSKRGNLIFFYPGWKGAGEIYKSITDQRTDIGKSCTHYAYINTPDETDAVEG